MKRIFALVLLLPSLGSCTVENDYYDNYREPPRARVEVPYSPVHRHREVAPRNYNHSHDRRVVVRKPANHHEHDSAPDTRVHGHDNRNHNPGTYEQSDNSNVRAHGHD